MLVPKASCFACQDAPGWVPSCTVSLQDDHLQLCTQLHYQSTGRPPPGYVPSCTVSLQDDHHQLCTQMHCQSTGWPPPAVCPVALSVYRTTTSSCVPSWPPPNVYPDALSVYRTTTSSCVPSCTVSLQDDHLQLCAQLHCQSTGWPPPGCVPSCTVSLQDDHLQLCAQLHCQSTGWPPPGCVPSWPPPAVYPDALSVYRTTTSSCVPSCTVSLQDDHLQAVCPVALSVYRTTTSRLCAQLHCQLIGWL